MLQRRTEVNYYVVVSPLGRSLVISKYLDEAIAAMP